MVTAPRVASARAAAVAQSDWQRGGRLDALRALSARAAKLTWSPALLGLLLQELFVEEDFAHVCGDPRKFPVQRYPQGVLLALGVRHSWREDDLKRFARRIGLSGRPTRSRDPR